MDTAAHITLQHGNGTERHTICNTKNGTTAEDSRTGFGPYPSRTLALDDKPASWSGIVPTLRLALSAAHASYSREGIHCKEIDRRVEGITHNKGRNLGQWKVLGYAPVK